MAAMGQINLDEPLLFAAPPGMQQDSTLKDLILRHQQIASLFGPPKRRCFRSSRGGEGTVVP